MARSVSKVMVAAAVGLAAGIAIGMLFAPAKGTKTRKRLKQRILDFADQLEEQSGFSLDLEGMDEPEPKNVQDKEDK